MCCRNGMWHLRIKIASPANTFAIRVAQAVPPAPQWSQMTAFTWRLNRRREIRTIVTFLVVLSVRGHDGCGVSWHLACYRMFCACARAFISDCFAELLCKVWEFLRDCFKLCQFSCFSCQNSNRLAYACLLACMRLPLFLHSAPLCDFCHFKHSLHGF